MTRSLLPSRTTLGPVRDRVTGALSSIRLPAVRWDLMPGLLAVLVIIASGIYSFGIGRNRFQVVSSFIVKQPATPPTTTATFLGPVAAGPTMLGSLEDGRFLAVYLTSPQVMGRVFDKLDAERVFQKRWPDPYAGLVANANLNQRLDFFRRQVWVWPQELTGVIQLTTTGLDPKTSFRLNELLLQEAQVFLNRMNQSISRDQKLFAEGEVSRARSELDRAIAALNEFQRKNGQLSPQQESEGTSSYLTSLEAKLVDLKVEESALRRQYKDPEAPEVVYVADQVRELEKEIAAQRRLLVSPQGRNLNQRATQGQVLQDQVTFANQLLQSALTASNNSRADSERQVKFLVRLSDPKTPAQPDSSWRWKVFFATFGGLIVVWGVGKLVLGISRRT